MGTAGRYPTDLLLRIIDWAERLERVRAGITLAQFLDDEIYQLAMAKCLEAIGDTAGLLLKMHPAFALDHPEIELRNAYGMRNSLAHDYESSDLDIVWDTAAHFVPVLADQARKIVGQSGDLP